MKQREREVKDIDNVDRDRQYDAGRQADRKRENEKLLISYFVLVVSEELMLIYEEPADVRDVLKNE